MKRIYSCTFLKSFTILALVVLGSFFLFSGNAFAATITVNSNADTTTDGDGNCTLRQAIENANADSDTTGGDCVAGSGTDTINFNAAMTITTGTSTFALTSPMIINGITGGLGTCSTKSLGIVINGAAATSHLFSLNAGASGSTIHGLVIMNATGDGINMSSSSNNTITCNIIGLTQAGTVAAGNDNGIKITGGSGNTIGGGMAGDGNIVSGNSLGIWLESTADITIQGNIIGLDKTGTVSMETQDSGISINNSSDILIGGDTSIERNIISGNEGGSSAEGIIIYGTSGSSDITIQGNYMGTDITGMLSLPNTQEAIEICGPDSCGGGSVASSNIIIGGSNAGEGNIISGNKSGPGIGKGVTGDGIETLTVLGNYFGLASDGETLLTNGAFGITIANSSTVTIGGSGAYESNIFAHDGSDETYYDLNIVITGGSDVLVIGNFFNVMADGNTVIDGTDVQYAIFLEDVAGATVGGANSGEENIIGMYNIGTAIAGGSDIAIAGNYIGIGSNGSSIVGDRTALASIYSTGLSGVIGGVTANHGNDIANSMIGIKVQDEGLDVLIKNNEIHNTVLGIMVVDISGSDTTATILENRIYDNEVMGIDLNRDLDGDGESDVDDGVQNTNDSGDNDSGPNDYLNYPVIVSAYRGSNSLRTSIVYTLDVPVSAYPYRVEFFKNPSGLNDSGVGEGETLIASSEVYATSGVSSFEITIDGIDTDNIITATTTKCLDATCTTYGGTSEFSEYKISTRAGGGGGGGSSRSTPTKKTTPSVSKESTPKKEAKEVVKNIVKVVLRQGEKGTDVAALQKFLIAHNVGYYASLLPQKGGADGMFGPATKAALVEWQGKNGLVPDGIFGPKTKAKMLAL